jgi:selenocysteine-specific elongation factor
VAAVDLVDAEIELLAGSPELRHKASVRFHCFTSETLARVLFYVNRPLQPGARALVRLKLAKPVVVLPQDRFVLRRLTPMATIGGGFVLDAHPILRTRKTKTAAWLEQINRATLPEQLLLRVARRESAGLSTAALSRELGWTKDALAAAAQPMIESGELLKIAGGLLLTRQAFSAAQAQVLDRLTRMEDKKPNHPGWKRSELRHQTGLQPDVFDAVLAQLVNACKLRVAGAGAAEVVALYQDVPQLPETDRKAMERIAAAYKSPGLQAPLFSEVVRNMGLAEAEARRLMTLLLREKILVKLGTADLFMHRTALTRLQQEIASLRGQNLDVTRFKQITGLSRKYAIPLLEYLDRVHVTRKQGDTRLVL